MVSIIESFSYQIDEMEMMNKAKEIAKRNQMSFSTYVKELIKQDIEKNVNPQTDPLNLSRNSSVVGTNIRSLDLYKVSQQEINDNLNELEDKRDYNTLSNLGLKAYQIVSVVKTKARNRNKEINQYT